MVRVSISIIFVFCLNQIVLAQEEPKGYRLEVNLSYEHLTPHKIYGTWKMFSATLFKKIENNTTYFLQGGAFSRREGDGVLGSIGAYKDWTDWIYTYSAVSAGSRSDYLPEARIDVDLNIKIGVKKDTVLTFGGSYIDYHDIHRDTIISTGVTLYRESMIYKYRIFRNESDPGNAISYSHLIGAGYGSEGWQWTYIDLSFGKQAYLATYLTNPEEVTQDSLYISLKHRRWTGKNKGVFLDVTYAKIKDGYEKYGLSSGFFIEF